jgi:hypothetical protein
LAAVMAEEADREALELEMGGGFHDAGRKVR